MTPEHVALWPGPVPAVPVVPAVIAPGALVTRRGTAEDAPGIHALILANLAEGHLLPRTMSNVTALAHRFTVVECQGAVLACGELAPLSPAVAEVRSLVVHPEARGLGLGRVVIADLRRRARSSRFRTLCAFTHGPEFFVRLGFSIVPHAWVPEKVANDCWNCTKFPHCGQYAMVIPAAAPGEGIPPVKDLS
jgi:amino-acid N-acetyltransferase